MYCAMQVVFDGVDTGSRLPLRAHRLGELLFLRELLGYGQVAAMYAGVEDYLPWMRAGSRNLLLLVKGDKSDRTSQQSNDVWRVHFAL